MKRLIILFAIFLTVSCNSESNKPEGQKSVGLIPSKEDIATAMKAVWEKQATNLNPQETIIINDIKMGESEESNYAMQLEGVPKGSTVTHAKIDFTHATHYTNELRDVRRIMTAWVYKDQFGEWAVMNVGTTYP